MKEKLELILEELDMPLSTIEKELGFSNGLLGKAKKGESNLSNKKFEMIKEFHAKIKDGKKNDKLLQTDIEKESDNENEEIGKRLIEFCNQNKTNVEDLFEWLASNYGNSLKKEIRKEVKIKSLNITDNPKSNYSINTSNFMSDLRKKKCGL